MPGRLLFVHGTGVRDVSATMALIREGVAKHLEWPVEDVVPVEWGRAVGPQDLDVSSALPPDDGERAIGEGPPSEEELWELLLVDPTVELRALAEVEPGTETRIQPGEDAPEVALVERLSRLALPDPSAAENAGLDPERVQRAGKGLAADPLPAEAAGGGADQSLVVAAMARAVVAIALAEAIDATHADAPAPAAASDAAARDALVAAVIASLGGLAESEARGFVFDKIVAPLATRVAMSKRAAFMEPFADFARDVTFYLEHGEAIRNEIAGAVRANQGEKPLVLLGHSLGGIAAVDLMAEQAAAAEPLPVDLLVTVGSQSPILYLMDSLSSLSPRQPEHLPFAPWLNVYNRRDLLSFCAERVFPGQTGIVDAEVEAKAPFPASHSAYWREARTFELIRDHLP
jgi:hypothetical protein